MDVEEIRTGDMHVHEMEVDDSHFEDYPGDDFEKVEEFTLEKNLQTLADPDPAPEIPQKKPLPVLNRGGRGLRPRLGERIYHGSDSLEPNGLKPLHPLPNPLTNSLPNQPTNHTV